MSRSFCIGLRPTRWSYVVEAPSTGHIPPCVVPVDGLPSGHVLKTQLPLAINVEVEESWLYNEPQTGIHHDTSFLDHSSGNRRAVELRGRGAEQRQGVVASV
jgi:hypothetical protein